jgi:sulfatase maturation enzyme AslB (radical SAM superfamily)
MKPLCYIPWTSIDIAPMGEITPCCKFVMPANNKFNITKNTITDYTSSSFLKSLKEQMHGDVLPEGCIRCQTEENNNIESKRQLDYKRWKDHFDSYTEDKGIIVVSIAFGNICNLKCIICGPDSSSRWRKEYKDIYGVNTPLLEVIENITADAIYDNMPNVIHFDIHGGEPFLSELKKQHELLKKYIDSGQSKNISLHYHTNAQHIPTTEFWELWQHFKEVDIQLSIDGIFERFEYIRFLGKHDKLDKVVDFLVQKEKELNNIKLSVSHTVSAYNIYYLDEFFSWCKTKGLPKPWCGRVYSPKELQPSIYPKKIKDLIVTKLRKGKHIDVINWSRLVNEEDNSKYFQNFLSFTNRHDLYRGTNFAKTFPELEELINEL